jgi:pimeloyl-ACP methyl ester carboxylesterase
VRPFHVTTIAVALALASALAGDARALPTLGSTRAAAPSWCAPEVEELPGDVCHVDGGQRGDRRALVVFLHGAIAEGTTWQWTQERALARQAREGGFEAIFPRAPLGPNGYLWPGTVKSQEAHEEELANGWRAARTLLEARAGKPFDDVFVMGFSSGAYFASSLALRGRLEDVAGYALFAGGAAYTAKAGSAPRPTPVFVGVCSDDGQTADDSRSVGAALAARGWPRRVDEEHVGHMFSDIHVIHAIGYLRGAAARAHR